ncbi:unnamed protein product [Spodoptera littoralis]|uniref:Uncharacterized protein n=1 Tax=Spodoptera littoralis TaxID=7109 RepID=A0A9P0N4K7_SPOLI|nr:unnamed protein product [Spodoptera littoralis]CAH1641324.1 unnamed protein product [Spodoptera littoralis]
MGLQIFCPFLIPLEYICRVVAKKTIFKVFILRYITTKCIPPEVDASPRINIILVIRRPIAATSSHQVTVDIDSSLMMADRRRPLPSILPILLYVLEHVSMSTWYIKYV